MTIGRFTFCVADSWEWCGFYKSTFWDDADIYYFGYWALVKSYG